jgi:hypothetical protein
MNVETIGFVGFVFAAASLAAILYERRMDVLHGPYIQGRAERNLVLLVERFLTPIQSAAERLRWKVRPMIHRASIIAC